jgi:hypothetical protein
MSGASKEVDLGDTAPYRSIPEDRANAPPDHPEPEAVDDETIHRDQDRDTESTSADAEDEWMRQEHAESERLRLEQDENDRVLSDDLATAHLVAGNELGHQVHPALCPSCRFAPPLTACLRALAPHFS